MAPLKEKLGAATESIVRLFDADFRLIWLIRRNDRMKIDHP
jgi:hypothetical protein